MTTDQVQELVDILARLRGPQGCPWDREQTHQTLKRYATEETGELLDAIDTGDDAAIVDELGDLLLQIVFHCQIAREAGRFDLQTVARRCCEKMVRRHPHVFGDRRVSDAQGVLTQWDEIKRTERGAAAPASAIAGVPRHLPALHRAQAVQKKAAKVGFDWPDITGVLDKIDEELAELRQALHAGDDAAVAEELGDLLFAVVNLSRFRKHQAEELLHATVRKFERRFMAMEAILKNAGRRLEECTLEEMDRAWNQAKADARAPAGP